MAYIRFIETHKEYYKKKDTKIFDRIQTEKEYKAILHRIEKLLQNPDNIENTDAPDYIELNQLSDFVADYEERTYPIVRPNF